MSSKFNNDDIPKQSYFRLLQYAMPYKKRLAIGIIAGFVVGGSLFGSMMMIPQLMRAIDKKFNESDSQTTKTLDKIVATSKNSELSDDERRLALEKLVYPDKHADKLANEVASWKKSAKQWGIDLPLNYRDGTVRLETSWFSFSLPAEDKMGKMTWQFFTVFVIAFVSFWTLKNLATYINRYFTRWVGTRVVADLRNSIFDKLLGESLRFYGKMDVGQLIARCTNDTASIETAVANTIADATRCPLEILACAAAIIIGSIRNNDISLPLILFVGLPLCILPIVLIGRKIRKVYRSAFKKIAVVVSRMHEVFSGIVVVKAYHAEKREMNRFREVNQSYFHTVVRALKLELLMSPLMETVAVGSTLVFLIYAYSRGVSITELALLLVPAFMAYQPIKKLAKISTYLQRSMAAADRYFYLMDLNTSVKEKENPLVLDEFKKEINFESVGFSYEEDRKVLDDVTFKIPKGSVVAVVGKTGSGKSTIANLIARFYDAESGTVTVDGMDVRDMKISSLRDLIGIVTQDTILFNDTIAHNIAYGRPEASREEVIEAAKQANAHQFIVDGRHEGEYESVVGEKGCNVSGGEKQRLAIARAILKNPPILILDEATSALDTVTERLVQEALDHVMENRTVFAIAHRLSTIKHADLILVIDEGKIIERGTHDELMATDGKYRKLHDTQFGIK